MVERSVEDHGVVTVAVEVVTERAEGGDVAGGLAAGAGGVDLQLGERDEGLEPPGSFTSSRSWK